MTKNTEIPGFYMDADRSAPSLHKPHYVEMSDDIRRQYIDARSVFTALEDATQQAKQVRGGMYWKTQSGRDYLIRTSVKNTQKSLGVRSPETESISQQFLARKAAAAERVSQLQTSLKKHQRLNRALFVGRAPQIVVELLNQLVKDDVAEHFLVIGTHALYAYESASGVRISESDALATRDVDLLWDTRKRLSFIAVMELQNRSMLALLRKVDKTFDVRSDQLFTAVNSDGFEVDFIRRESQGVDPHPLKLTQADDEVWATEAKRAEYLLSAPKFSAMVVSASGHMARMNTVAPSTFAQFKLWMAQQRSRDPLKRNRDLKQAQIVTELVTNFLS